jgi:hypothetical protein
MPRQGELHGIKDKKHNELSAIERARSINGHFLSLERAIRAHLNKSLVADDLKKKYIIRLKKIIDDLNKK